MSNPDIANRVLKYYNIDYDLISKTGLEELKNYLRFHGFEANVRKNQLLARVFAGTKNGVKPIKTAVEVEANLKTEYLVKLEIGDKNILDPFKFPHVWMNEDKYTKFWPMLFYTDTFNYLMSFP